MQSTSRRRRETSSSSNASYEENPKKMSKLEESEVFVDGSDETPSLSEMYKILMVIKRNTRKILEEHEVLRQECNELKKSLEFNSNLLEDMKKENADLRREVTKLNQARDESQEKIKLMQSRIENFESEQDELQQYQRKYNLEIHGIPEKEDEDVEELIVKLAEKLDVNITNSDIDIAHRLYRKSGIKPIIVRFFAHQDKYNLYQARFKLRKLGNKSRFQGADNIYINENLTKTRKALFSEVRKKKVLNNWYAAWTNDGKIFVKTSKEGYPKLIKDHCDLEKIW